MPEAVKEFLDGLATSDAEKVWDWLDGDPDAAVALDKFILIRRHRHAKAREQQADQRWRNPLTGGAYVMLIPHLSSLRRWSG